VRHTVCGVALNLALATGPFDILGLGFVSVNTV
jgi:hypothetical protein